MDIVLCGCKLVRTFNRFYFRCWIGQSGQINPFYTKVNIFSIAYLSKLGPAAMQMVPDLNVNNKLIFSDFKNMGFSSYFLHYVDIASVATFS